MGREVKRVPLDFQWTENKVWEGFLNPHYKKCHNCPQCEGRGETVASQRLGDLVSLLMLSGSDAIGGKCHPYFYEAPLLYTQGKACGQDMIELTAALAGREPSTMGHDCLDKWQANKKIIAAAELPEAWGTCLACNGSGTIWDSPEDEQAADDWSCTEPPKGEGYQIWETVSEGSPISPVFATPEELAQHMAGRVWGADRGTSYETWLNFITSVGWAPSMIMGADGIQSGVAASAP